jgi:ADP-ribose pyrophosphatase YjhB (NUDIX family)
MRLRRDRATPATSKGRNPQSSRRRALTYLANSLFGKRLLLRRQWTMIVIDNEHGKFSLRVAGILLHNEHVLLHQLEGTIHWSLPGGRLELLEDSRTALARELREELGVESVVGDLLWVVENFFTEAPRAHELALYYRATLPNDSPYIAGNPSFTRMDGSDQLLFQWFPLDGLDSVALFPSFLRAGLRDLPDGTTHLIHIDPAQ